MEIPPPPQPPKWEPTRTSGCAFLSLWIAMLLFACLALWLLGNSGRG